MSPQRRDGEFMRRTAENYERYFVPIIGAPAAVDVVEAVRLRPGERVLDAACDTGVVTKLAGEQVAPGAVAGLAPNPAMLADARATTPSDKSIDWHEAPAEDLPFPDESFDAVLCGMGLQFFSDKEAGLREFHRVLVPGGRLVANVPGPTLPPFEIMADAPGHHIGPESASFVYAVFSLHDPDDLRDLATHAGFRKCRRTHRRHGTGAGPPGGSVAIHLEPADRGHRGGGPMRDAVPRSRPSSPRSAKRSRRRERWRAV